MSVSGIHAVVLIGETFGFAPKPWKSLLLMDFWTFFFSFFPSNLSFLCTRCGERKDCWCLDWSHQSHPGSPFCWGYPALVTRCQVTKSHNERQNLFQKQFNQSKMHRCLQEISFLSQLSIVNRVLIFLCQPSLAFLHLEASKVSHFRHPYVEEPRHPLRVGSWGVGSIFSVLVG